MYNKSKHIKGKLDEKVWLKLKYSTALSAHAFIVPRAVNLLSNVTVEVHVLGDDLVRPLVGVSEVTNHLLLGLDPHFVVEEGERIRGVIAEL